MKKVLALGLAALLVLGASACGKQAEEYEKTEFLLAKETMYNSDGMELLRREYTYNDQDQLITETYYKEGNTVSGRVEHTYHENGTEKLHLYYHGDGTLYNLTEYDENGNKIVDESYYTFSYKSEYFYDDHNLCIKEIFYENNVPLAWFEYEYDTNGYLIKKTCFSYADGKIESWNEYTYDENGNEILRIDHSLDANTEDIWTKEYNEHGDLIKNTMVRAGISYFNETTYEYLYNDNGIIVEMTCYENGVIDKHSTYNDNGVTITDASYDEGIISESTEHSYDKYGNEIKRTKYDANGEIVEWTQYEYQ